LPQGERAAKYSVDMAVRKEFLKKRTLAISLGLNDIFNTDRTLSYTTTDLSDQEYYRKRASRELRLNMSWRFGKMDAAKKNKKKEDQSENNNDI
jgi:hypothetical protein